VGALAGAAGCTGAPATGPIDVPSPVNLLLPHAIRIHPFTGLRGLDASGKVRGLEVRMEALDAYQDSTKAFGTFHFELYHFKPFSGDRKGERIETWEVDLMNPRENIIHWDPITRAYIFKLQLYRAVPAGQRLVLTASFDSPFNKERLFAAEHEILAQ
jgi:hypothetical protein